MIMQKQALNPFLPLNECMPDGEPHVFSDRVYLYWSHDRMGGDTFCAEPYAVWSAPVSNLSEWSNRGISYRAEQDPHYSPERPYLFAPDCVQGNGGRITPSESWQTIAAPMGFGSGKQPLYLQYAGTGSIEIREFTLSKGAGYEAAGV